MKARNTYSKGLIAILLLGSISCSKGFQTLPSQSNERSASDHQVVPDVPWQFSAEEAKDQAAENAPVQEASVEEPPAQNQTAEEKPVVKEPESIKPKEKEKEEEEDEKPVAKAVAEKSDFTGPGRLKPTIYYFPVFNEDESKCEKDTMMHASGGKELLKVCEKTAKECGLQGSCAIVQDGVTRSFNVLGARNGQDRFFEIKDSCKYGFGVQNACLDPYYTLAADLSLYEPGQVIYIPGVVGMELPDGSKHSGYFVIRDRGRGVTGTGRFDFFSGMMAWRDSKNPFTKMGLGDVKTNIPYYKVKGKTAQQVLRHRAFPKLPRK